MYSISLRGSPSPLCPPFSLSFSHSLSFLSLSREEEEEQEKRNAENVGTKGTEKVPAQEDEGEGDEGAKRGCSLSTPLRARDTRIHSLQSPTPSLLRVRWVLWSLRRGNERGGREAVHRLLNATFTGERASRRDTSGVGRDRAKQGDGGWRGTGK